MPNNNENAKHTTDISEALHSSAVALFKVGALDEATMREFDARHLPTDDDERV
jgi:putative transcriptional regulator